MQRLQLVLLLPILGLAACTNLPLSEPAGDTASEVGGTPAETAESEARSGSAEAIRELVDSGRTSRASGDYAQAPVPGQRTAGGRDGEEGDERRRSGSRGEGCGRRPVAEGGTALANGHHGTG